MYMYVYTHYNTQARTHDSQYKYLYLSMFTYNTGTYYYSQTNRSTSTKLICLQFQVHMFTALQVQLALVLHVSATFATRTCWYFLHHMQGYMVTFNKLNETCWNTFWNSIGEHVHLELEAYQLGTSYTEYHRLVALWRDNDTCTV